MLWPRASSGPTTPSQLDEPAYAPWTRTSVVMAALLRGRPAGTGLVTGTLAFSTLAAGGRVNHPADPTSARGQPDPGLLRDVPGPGAAPAGFR
ncbi:hypothetical protein GCM10022197_05190 [Microlunatus spumicola]|uniref:Uncharacterized protein n=1 Tax=Microlunatus spumicola TaxID=81499 RepID=A0ABP6WL25_9ACTN